MIKVKLTNHYTGPNVISEGPLLIFRINYTDQAIKAAKSCIPKINILLDDFNFWDQKNPNRPSDIVMFFDQFITSFLKKDKELIIKLIIINDKSFDLAVGYYNERITISILELCTKLITHTSMLTNEKIFNSIILIENKIAKIRPDFQIQFLINYAKKKKIPFNRAFTNNSELPFWQFGWGENSNIFFESSFMEDSYMGRKWIQNKIFTKNIFNLLGLRTPEYGVAFSNDTITETISKIGFPCVVKPVDGHRANGVTTNINNNDELINAIEYAKTFTTKKVMIEKFIEGEVYRILIIRGRFWCAIKREAAYIISDGKSSIEELIMKYNIKLEHQSQKFNIPSKIEINNDVNKQLKIQNIDLCQVLPKGQKVKLQSIPLLSSGAVYADATKKINPEIIIACEALAMQLGIQSCGIDFITKNISSSLTKDGYFIELNATPGLRVPLAAGINEDIIGEKIIGDKVDSIPLNLIICDSSLHKKIFEKISLNQNQGWIFEKKSGIGKIEFQSDQNVTINKLFHKIIRYKNCKTVVVLCDYKDLMNEGLPFLKIVNSWVVKNELFTSEWCNVIKTHSTHFKELDSIEEITEYFFTDNTTPN